MRLLFILCLLVFPLLARAECRGVDLRGALSVAQQSEIGAAVAAEPNAVGNFWRATRAGREITLVGTVHLDDPRLDPLMAALHGEITGADLVFLEMTSREQTRLQDRLGADPAMIMLPQGSLIDLLPEATWARLAAAAEARGLPGVMAARMQPWYLSLVLSLPPCALGAGAPRGLDARIEDVADGAGVPKLPLEPYDTLFTLFASEPLEAQLDFLRASVMDEAMSENMLATTLNAYFDQAPAELWHMSRVAARDQIDMAPAALDALFHDLEQALLVARNRDWVARLEAADAENIFAAFGAAHLFGEAGMVALLRAEGYDVQRFEP